MTPSTRITRWLIFAGIMVVLLIATGTAFATGGAPRVATLSGAAEVPAGDPDGSGFAEITLNVGQRRVCWTLTVQDIADPVAAHIHVAPAGENGPVVVPLSPPAGGSSSGCAEDVDPALIQAIISSPEQYYVNVHTPDFPGGAVRGQLSNRGQNR